jgi:hypothetical protein
MQQTKFQSFVEASLNTMSGFLISFAAWMYVVGPLFNVPHSARESFGITMFFTLLSIARSYAWRRAANWWHHRPR